MENSDLSETPPETASKPDRKNRAVLKTCARIGLIVLMMPLVFSLIAAVMLIGQDVTAPSWVSSRLAERANASLEGGQIDFEEITVNLGTDLHPRVQMSGVTLQDAEGTEVAKIGSVEGLLSPRGVVFERKALLQDVALSGIDVNLLRDETGALALSFGQSGGEISVATDPEAVFLQLHEAFAIPALEALEQVSAKDLRFTYQDDASGTIWSGAGQHLQLDLKGETRVLQSEIVIKSEETESETRLAVGYTGGKSDLAATVSLDVRDATGPDIVRAFPALDALSAIKAPISLKASASVDASGNLLPLSAKVTLGEGSLDRGEAVQPLHLENAAASVSFDLNTQIFEIPSLVVNSDLLAFDGSAQISQNANGRMIGQFSATNVLLNLPDELEAPLEFEQAFVDWRMDAAPLEVDIGQLTLSGPDLTLSGAGQFKMRDGGLSGALRFDVSDMSRNQALALWPLERAPGTRRWAQNNLKSAYLTDISGAARFGPDEAPVWSLGFGFEDAELRVVKDTPHIQSATGYASFADGAFGVTLFEGHILAAEGGRIDVSGSTVDVAEMRVKHGPLDIDVKAQGSITSILSVLDQSPIKAMQKAGLPVNVVDGRTSLQGTITFPRVNPVPGDAIRYDIQADLTRVTSNRLVPERTIRSASLQLDVDNEGLRIRGPARLDGVPLTGVYSQVFGEPGAKLAADIEISPESLTALNIELPPGTVSGRGLGALEVAIRKGEPPEFVLSSDLRGVRVAVPPVGWSKPPNQAGRLRVAGRLGDRPAIEDLQVSGGGLAARGSVSLTAENRLEAARFTQLEIGNWFNAPLTLRGRGPGRPPAVEINGGGLDLRRARFGPRQGESGPLEIALDRMQITQGIALTNFKGSFAGAGGFNGSFSGNLNGGPAIQGTVVPQNGRSAVRLRSDDAGGIARAAGFLKGGTGGSLDLILSPAGGEGTFDGELTVRQLRVREAPAMAALLDAISVVGLLQQLDGQGLAFEEVDARFRLTPSQVIVSQASAVGPGLGISLDGVYQLASEQLDFQGVVSPFFLLNGIGSVLTRKGEGLIGFNFTVRGKAASSQVSVNPLSALTPGMFREIFRRPPPQVGQ